LALNDAGVVDLRQAKRLILNDGQSVVGVVEGHYGLYLAVTQSGVTLGPLIGSLAAIEIVDKSSVELLKPFRPSRF
jgi:glycine/D-amino acid oxidase-like deaminating enzyme